MIKKITEFLRPEGLSQARQKSLMAVALMSFCWSMSSLIVFSILPAFLIDELGASHINIGIMEGVAISLAFAAKVVTGVSSDIWRTRKPFIVLGTVFTVMTKVLFVIASNLYWIFAARFIDRIAKGVRSAPTDALLADLGSNKNYTSIYGIRQALYTFGAVCGAVAASICMFVTANNYRTVFLIAAVPALLSLWICVSFVQEATSERKDNKPAPQWVLKDIGLLPAQFWFLQVVTLFLMLARFSEAFLTLRAKELAWSVPLLPALIIIMDLVHAGVALLCGNFEHRITKNNLFLLGLFFLIISNIILAFAPNAWVVVIGIIFVGIHMGITQGLLRSLIAQSTPVHLRGTAFALFYSVSGFAVLLGNTGAGYCADHFGLFSVFFYGAFFTGLSFILWLLWLKHGYQATKADRQ